MPALARLSPMVAALALASACGASEAFDAPLTLGDRVVPASVLNRGKDLFDRYCAACHGADGRADTPTARRLDPPPRDLTLADYQRRSDTAPGALPNDADLRATVRFGIAGSGMPAWPNLADDDLDAVVQYIKAFSPRWRGATAPLTPGAQTVLPARGMAASVRAGQTWRGDATTPSSSRLALRAADPPVAALGVR